MTPPIPFLSDEKYKFVRNLCIVIVLIFISLGQIPTILSGWNALLIFVQIPTLTLLFIGAICWNIYRLIPRLLLRNRFVAYISVLFGLALLFTLVSILFEWMILTYYQLPTPDYGFFAANGIFVFDFLSSLIGYFISLGATSVVVFLNYWWKSGERIHELEETGVRVELAKARSKIDSDALLDVLKQAASIAVSLPHEASRILMELSTSLRRQLYESDRKQVVSPPSKKTERAFREQNRLLDFLIEKRYRLARNLLFLIAVCIVGSSNVDPQGAFSFVEFGAVVAVLLVIGYSNIYVLIPRLLFKNKPGMYLLSIVLFISSFLLLLLPPQFIEQMSDFIWVVMITNIAEIVFVYAGITSFVLFQHWARNERYIARLEDATMRAELEQLQNQINPHFLFNMLNNILVLIRENPEEAVVILHKMSDMLQYQFNDMTKKEVLLNDDIHFLTDFLNLEKIRRDRFEFTITVENNAESIAVPPLLFIPFVENAVKHSADAANLSYVRLYFSMKDNRLHFTCHNSKPLKPRKKNEYSGLGLVNVRRRLDLLYGEHYSLDIREDETHYTVQLEMKI